LNILPLNSTKLSQTPENSQPEGLKLKLLTTIEILKKEYLMMSQA
jgi:hypothetical protein